MARLTVEDCLKHVKNRFELVLKAAKRARNLERGATAKVEWEGDKPTVVALREIAMGIADEPEVKKEEEVVFDLPLKESKPVIVDDPEDDDESFEVEEVIEEEMIDGEPEVSEISEAPEELMDESASDESSEEDKE